MNLPTLLTRAAALQGHRLAISAQSVDAMTDRSTLLPDDKSGQLGRARGIRIHRNVVFATIGGAAPGGGNVRLRMDILTPSTPGPHPLVVYVPGGGFVFAAKSGAARMRGNVAAAGYVVASVEYRTTRHGATYVDGIADIRAAIAHLSDHASELGIDPSRVALWGESAGGYLAAMLGVNGEVDAVIDMFGGSALDRIADGFDSDTVARVFQRGNPLARYVLGPNARTLEDDAAAVRASDPTRRIVPDASVFLIFHGDDDRIVSPRQTAELHDALRDAGVESTRYIVSGAGHGELEVKSGEAKYWTTESILKVLLDFLGRTVGPYR